MMSSAKQAAVAQEVRLFVEEQAREGLLYMDCPSCTKTKGLMIGEAKEGGHWYKCLAAGCATFGTTNSTRPMSPKAHKVVTGRSIFPHYRCRKDWKPDSKPALRMCEQYGLTHDQVLRLADGIVVYGDKSFYVFPIYGPKMEGRGYMLRKYAGSGPKALYRPRYSTGPLLNWFLSDKQSGTIAVVEDPISACRLSGFCTTVALGGTSISQEGVEEILSLQPKVVYVILDNDAVEKGLAMARQFCGKGISIPLFGKDIKDMGTDEFENLGALISGR
jgi:hypothetical protein